ncbi:MAG: hypothetical protein R3248_06650 [Candidatus Promineifilaceae bacterium]|nr:hypothetical protein [Candidatus Promineifilaceae bacterium]
MKRIENAFGFNAQRRPAPQVRAGRPFSLVSLPIHRSARIGLLFTLLLSLLSACGATEPTPSGAEAPEPESPTAEPTATAEPTVTATTAPTDTPVPTSTPTEEATPSPTRTLEPEGLFHFLDGAVVASGTSGDWDSKYVNPGAMLFHDGQFHMFRNGFIAWPGVISVGYMTSDDGRSWRTVQDEPVFTSEQIPYVLSGAAVSSVYVTDDGTWIMYFHTLDSPSSIGRATAPAPTGPWTADPEPVLTPGGDGAWDRRITWPSVVKTDEGLVMYYSGLHSFTNMIGRATSDDGITWTKYDDPETTEGPYHESDPVLMPADGWDGGDVDRPEARLTPEGWVMLYVGDDLNKRGLAFSDDGINWTPHPDNPVLSTDQSPRPGGTTWDTALLYHDDVYFYYMEIGSLAGTSIFLAQHEGSLRN